MRTQTIPGFRRYTISESGIITDTLLSKEIIIPRDKAGYYHTSLISDEGKKTYVGRHRLLCLTFKPLAIIHNGLYVNHLNGVKGDDRLCNLEWVSPQENVFHAGANGLTKKCLPVQVRNARTGEIRHFNSYRECANSLGLTKDAVAYRINNSKGSLRIFPEGYQYALKSRLYPQWGDVDPTDVENQIKRHNVRCAILVKNAATGDITEIPSMVETADFLGIPVPTISTRLNSDLDIGYPDGYVLKRVSDQRNWPAVLREYKRKIKVIVKCRDTLEETLYSSIHECATAHGLLVTTLSERLKSNNPNKFWRDGFSYIRYEK